MYGTVARMRLLPGTEAEMVRLGKEYEGLGIPGYLATYVYKLDGAEDEYIMAVLFDSRESYHANAANPEQHTRFERMRALMAADPEWSDGEVIYAPSRMLAV